MKKIATLLGTAIFCQLGMGQQLLTTPNGNYLQNFDTTLTSTAAIPLPANWAGIKYGGTNTTPLYDPILATVGTGSGTAGALYSVGTATTDPDRAAGSLASGSLLPAFGTSFRNNTGTPIQQFSFSGVMEQWRTGSDASVTERLICEYSLNATSLSTGTWTAFPGMDLVEKLTSTTSAGQVNGNLPANQTAISGTLANINLGLNATIWIRWRDNNDDGSDGLYALDNFQLSYINGGADLTPPDVAALTPADNSTDVPVSTLFSIRFSENIQKGTGTITLKKTADGSTAQLLDVSSSTVTVSNNTASFSTGTLQNVTGYYIEITSGAFKDIAGNNFAGISGNTAWNFTTSSTFASFSFNTCTSYAPVPDGFTQYSVVGDSIWKCTSFGNNGTGGVQMNGYNNQTTSNDANEDWLISPALDLSGTNLPLLRFYSINAFAGPQLRLFISANYTPGNAPASATWTELNGRFPAENSRVWTLSDSISLAGFAQNNVHLAWVYYSTTAASARWTLDDVSLFSAPAAPQPNVVVAPGAYAFGYSPAGTGSFWRPFTLDSYNFTGPLTLTAPAGFQLSRDTTIAPSAAISYSAAEANAVPLKTFYARFVPDAADKNYYDGLTASTGSWSRSVATLSGTSLPDTKSLEIVNWNLEWFGTPEAGFGPTDKNLQFTNVLRVLRSLNADLYSLVEVVDTSRFRRLADSLGSDYGYIVSPHGTRAIDPANPFYNTNILTAQKEGFIYKKSIFSNMTARPFLRTTYNDTLNPSSYYWWSSGRFPYLMEADATLDGVTKRLTFVLLHAKANTGGTAGEIESYSRRKLGVLNLKDSLDQQFSNANLIILGDFNDRLSGTIAPTTGADTVSSYQALVADSTDNNSYRSLTLPFVNTSTTASTFSRPSAIDNVVISNEMVPYYIPGSTQIRSDVAGLVTNYASTTTDHYPIYTRYYFNQIILPVKIIRFTGSRSNATTLLQWQVSLEINTERYTIERSSNGSAFTAIGTVTARGAAQYQFNDPAPLNGNNYYRLKTTDKDGHTEYSSIVRVYFGREWQITLSPNPVKEVLYLQSSETVKAAINLYDAAGKKLLHLTGITIGASESRSIRTGRLPKGTYTIEVLSDTKRIVRQLVAE